MSRVWPSGRARCAPGHCARWAALAFGHALASGAAAAPDAPAGSDLLADALRLPGIGAWRASATSSAKAASDGPLYRMPPFAQFTPEQARKGNVLVLGTAASLVAVYGVANWWEDGFSGDFRVRREGWFGQATENGGADKLGHAFTTYSGTRLLTRLLEGLGNPPEDALRTAAWSAFGAMATVEIVDGFSKRYRFSPEDLAMNFAGAALAWTMERNPELDRKFDFRLHYWPSNDARRVDQVDPFGDYSGQRFLWVTKASGFRATRGHPWLRHLEFAVGYGTRGYEPDLGEERSRHIYYGLSLNLSKILDDTVFAGAPESPARRWSAMALELWQPPGTLLAGRHRLPR